jgi:peptide/nickel transport system permease protein
LDSNKILQISNLTTEFQDGPKRSRVVEKLSFSLEKEECLAIVGQSGSGKSVTALSLTGLVPSPPGIITGGSVNYLGEDILNLPIKSILGIRGRKIAYIFQDPQSSLHPLKTINAQISEAIFTHRSLDRKEIQIEVLSLLKKVRIAEPERVMISYPHQLSGGMRQRIGIAMALANKPDIIIADEPTTALDVTIQAGILALLNELRKDFKMSMIFISHDLNVVSQISDKVIVMLKGKIVEHGSTAQIMTKPRHAYTKRLLSCSPQFRKSNEFLNNTN